MKKPLLSICLIIFLTLLTPQTTAFDSHLSEYSQYGTITVDPTVTNLVQLQTLTRSFFQTYDTWLQNWKAQQLAEYMSFYHPDFTSQTSNMDFLAWQAHKNRVFNPRRPVTVDFTKATFHITNTTITMEAMQDYVAGRYKDYGKKTMEWAYSMGRWQITKEEWVAMERVAEPPIIIEPPIVIIPPKPDTLLPKWQAKAGQLPYEYINILLAPEKDFGQHLFVVEKCDQYAALYTIAEDRKSIELQKTYYISSGQNAGNKYKWRDLKTPEGMYFTLNFIPQRMLAPLYGSGAYVLDYPNELDRLRKKTGSGIWIHGSDKDIVPMDTEGCIRFENKEIDYFHQELKLSHAPIIISEVIEWTTYANLTQEIEKINKFISDWKTSWERQNLQAYLSYYSQEEFATNNQRMNYTKWADYKQGIFQQGNNVVVTLRDFTYHYADNLLLITCTQDYKSGTYQDIGKKHLVLKRQNNNWKIIQEEWVATKI